MKNHIYFLRTSRHVTQNHNKGHITVNKAVIVIINWPFIYTIAKSFGLWIFSVEVMCFKNDQNCPDTQEGKALSHFQYLSSVVLLIVGAIFF